MTAKLHVLHVSPHPDDEAVGCPAALLALRRYGNKVTNLVTSLGHPPDHDRRRAEVAAAADIGGFELLIDDDCVHGEAEHFESNVAAAILAVAAQTDDHLLLVSPSPHDNHPRHEKVGRAVASAARDLGPRAVWLMYAVWGSLPLPTTYYAFGEDEMLSARALLGAYSGEIARNDYNQLVYGRSIASTTLGMEQIFGFGASQKWEQAYTELYTEVQYSGHAWRAAQPRQIVAAAPVATVFERDISEWIVTTSVRRLARW
jgi:LmbE family N-acetylglucosaminyl deacetylase